MKNLLILIILLACFISPSLAQKNVFILVDLSGNPKIDRHKITITMRREAIELVRAIVLNNYDQSFNRNWKLSGVTDPIIKKILSGQGSPLISQNGFLMIMPFGEKDTYKNFKINRILKFPADFETYYKFPFKYKDQQTFGELAKAKAADIALEVNIKNYFLIVISGKGEDTRSLSYTQKEIEYLDKYRSAVKINSLAIFRYDNSNIDFKVEISYVDVSKMSGVAQTSPQIQRHNIDQRVLEIVSPQGSRKKPAKLSKKQILISWRCIPTNLSNTFKIRYTNLDKRKTNTLSVVNSRSKLLKLDPGRYKVTVSGGGITSKAQYFFVEEEGGTGGFLLFLFFMVLLGAAGYFLWKNFSQVKQQGGRVERKSGDIQRRKPSRFEESNEKDRKENNNQMGYF